MDGPEFAANRLRAALVGLSLFVKARRFAERAAKANFNPGQPRVPRGNVDGGQWTNGPGGLPVVRVQSTVRPPGRYVMVRPGARLQDPTPAQLARLAASRIAMNRAIEQVREVDPRWKPTPQMYETVEGEIAATDAVTREAEARSIDLANRLATPGPFALEWFPNHDRGRRFTPSERREINRIGRRYGCHTCGTTDPQTPSGNFIGDHQPAISLSPGPYRIYPQCWPCSLRQGGLIRPLIGGIE